MSTRARSSLISYCSERCASAMGHTLPDQSLRGLSTPALTCASARLFRAAATHPSTARISPGLGAPVTAAADHVRPKLAAVRWRGTVAATHEDQLPTLWPLASTHQ